MSLKGVNCFNCKASNLSLHSYTLWRNRDDTYAEFCSSKCLREWTDKLIEWEIKHPIPGNHFFRREPEE